MTCSPRSVSRDRSSHPLPDSLCSPLLSSWNNLYLQATLFIVVLAGHTREPVFERAAIGTHAYILSRVFFFLSSQHRSRFPARSRSLFVPLTISPAFEL